MNDLKQKRENIMNRSSNPNSVFVLIKARVPEFYEEADCAVIEVNENLVLKLDKRIAQTKAMAGEDFYATKWWDGYPYFVRSAGPDSFGLEMSDENFEVKLEENYSIPLLSYSDPEEYAPIDTMTMTISVCGTTIGNGKISAYFHWSGYDKYIGNAGRVATYEMDEATIDEWATLIGCTEILIKARRCRGDI